MNEEEIKKEKNDTTLTEETTNETVSEEIIPASQKEKEEKDIKYYLKEYIFPICVQCFIIYMFLQYVAFLTVVPTGSMIPTVEPHSIIIATKVYNPEKTIKRGDIVLFKSEEMGNILFKRCIGLPGERVDITKSGQIFINDAPLNEYYVKNTQQQEPQSFQIPEDCYFFLGDNRSGSFDAREWHQPYISKDKLIGEARFTLWPIKNFGVLK